MRENVTDVRSTYLHSELYSGIVEWNQVKVEWSFRNCLNKHQISTLFTCVHKYKLLFTYRLQ